MCSMLPRKYLGSDILQGYSFRYVEEDDVEEISGERRGQEEDRKGIQADRRTYEEFLCAFVCISQPAKILMLCAPAQTHH